MYNRFYEDLCSKMGLPESESLKKIWQTLCSDREASIASSLPGTVSAIASKCGLSEDETGEILLTLFRKGVAFISRRDGIESFKLAKNIVQFHDASILWEGATQEFYDLWKVVMDEDFASMMGGLPEAVRLPSFMRVIPIEKTVESESTVLPYEECVHLIENARALAVVKCPCRVSQQLCDAPLEACIQLDRGADYALERGHGRGITREEALDILRVSEEAGLVHLMENKGYGNAICNCCSCCCEMFRLKRHSLKEWILAPSRYVARVKNEFCTACSSCEDRCPVQAIEMGDSAVVDEALCIGCGLCVTSCNFEAIMLQEIRPREHIPVKS